MVMFPTTSETDSPRWYDQQREQFITSEIDRVGLETYLRETALARCELQLALEFEKLRPVILEATSSSAA